MPKKSVPPEVSAYLAKIGRKGGKRGAARTNALLSDEERSANASKAGQASGGNMTAKQRKERASAAAAARWGKAKKAVRKAAKRKA